MGKSSTETVQTRLDPSVEQFRDYVFNQTKAAARSPYQAYTGERVAGLDPNTLAGFQSLMGGNAQLTGALSGLVGNLGGLGAGPDIGRFMDPYLQQVVEASRGDFSRAREGALNTIGAQATAANAFGGARHGIAEGTALGDIARAEGSTLAGLRSSGFQNAVQAALQNQGQIGNLGLTAANLLNSLNVQGAQASIGLGEAQRGISQAGMDAKFQEFMRRINQPYMNLGLLQGTLGAAPSGQTQATKSSGNLLSTLGGIASVGASFLPGGQFASLIPAAAGLFGGGQADVTGQQQYGAWG